MRYTFGTRAWAVSPGESYRLCKQRPEALCPGLTGSPDRERLNILKRANICQTNTNKRKAGVEFLIPNKIEYKDESI